MSNARHQQALDLRDDHVQQLRAEITDTLTEITQLAELLAELADTRQSIGIGVISEAAANARAAGDALDRAAARGQLSHITTTGLGWMNTAAGIGTGQIQAPVTMPAVSALAQIRFTLQHHLARLSRPAASAARRAAAAETAQQYCAWPRPAIAAYLATAELDVDCSLTELITRLQALCSSYSNRPGLAAIARDLEHLEATARNVVDGPARTTHPDPCPWCGRKSLVVHHRTDATALTTTDQIHRLPVVIRCEGDHPCRCNFEHCACHRNPRTNRHEWINSGRAAHTWHTLRNLQNTRKELTAMETKALDALSQIDALHRSTWVYDDGTERDAFVVARVGYPIPADHECSTHCPPADPDGAETWHALPVCTTCFDWAEDGGPTNALYPCLTIQAIHAADLDITTGP